MDRLEGYAGVLRVVAGREHPAGLEQAYRLQTPSHVARHRPHKAGQQGSAQDGLLLAKRVLDSDSHPARIPERETERVQIVLPDEAERLGFGETGADQGFAESPDGQLLRGETALPTMAHQIREAVVAVEAGDLLDQIGRTGDIRAMGRNGHPG